MQPHGYPAQQHAHAMQGPPPTVWGVPLEPGERVLLYKRQTGSGERIFMFFMGILLMPVLFGFVLLYWAITYDKTAERVHAITNHRLMTISNARLPRTVIRLPEITRVVRVTGSKNQFVVHSQRSLIIFSVLDFGSQVIEPVMASLNAPDQLPTAYYEP